MIYTWANGASSFLDFQMKDYSLIIGYNNSRQVVIILDY
jgi:hypothetical protein